MQWNRGWCSLHGCFIRCREQHVYRKLAHKGDGEMDLLSEERREGGVVL